MLTQLEISFISWEIWTLLLHNMWAMNLLSLGNKMHVLGAPGLISIDNRIGAADS